MFVLITTVTRRVSNVEQELLTFPQHLRSPLVFSGVRIALSSVFPVMQCFVRRCLSFVHCIFSPSLIYGSCLSLGVFKTFISNLCPNVKHIFQLDKRLITYNNSDDTRTRLKLYMCFKDMFLSPNAYLVMLMHCNIYIWFNQLTKQTNNKRK